MKQKLRGFVKQLKRELRVYRMVMAHEQTSWLARLVLGAAIGYLVLPFDLIPDAIPVLGQLDDLLIVPALFWLALKLIPEEIIQEARERVRAEEEEAEAERDRQGETEVRQI